MFVENPLPSAGFPGPSDPGAPAFIVHVTSRLAPAGAVTSAVKMDVWPPERLTLDALTVTSTCCAVAVAAPMLISRDRRPRVL